MAVVLPDIGIPITVHVLNIVPEIGHFVAIGQFQALWKLAKQGNCVGL
jgi:hypothetical protein